MSLLSLAFPPPLCICWSGALLSLEGIYFRKSAPNTEFGSISEGASDTAYGTEMEWPGLQLTGRCDLRWW